MIIHLEEFLPASKQQLNKLIKINKLDWEHSESNVQQMIEHCKVRIEEEKQRKLCAEEKYLKNAQKALDTHRIIEARKMPSGVPLTKAELKAKKEEHRHLKAVVDAATNDHAKSVRNIEKLKKNLQILEEA